MKLEFLLLSGAGEEYVACIAYSTEVETGAFAVEFAWSLCNRLDKFSKPLARDISAGRLLTTDTHKFFINERRFTRHAIVKTLAENMCGCFPDRLQRLAQKEWRRLVEHREKIKNDYQYGAFPEEWLSRLVEVAPGKYVPEKDVENQKRSGEPRQSQTASPNERTGTDRHL